MHLFEPAKLPITITTKLPVRLSSVNTQNTPITQPFPTPIAARHETLISSQTSRTIGRRRTCATLYAMILVLMALQLFLPRSGAQT